VLTFVRGHCVLVDPGDAHLIAEYNWRIDETGYVTVGERTETGTRRISLHRPILSPPDAISARRAAEEKHFGAFSRTAA
jgi:hypothetical protein